MDLDAIALGEDFVEAIETTVEKCDVLIAVIGNNWLTSTDEHGGRRLDNPEDFVRMEIRTALKRKIRVIPVLVDGAVMPRSTDLPEDLKPLVRRSALRITDTSFDGDCRRLVATIKQVLERLSAKEQERLGTEQRQREEAEARERAEQERQEAEQREKERIAAEQRQREEAAARERAEKELVQADQGSKGERNADTDTSETLDPSFFEQRQFGRLMLKLDGVRLREGLSDSDLAQRLKTTEYELKCWRKGRSTGTRRDTKRVTEFLRARRNGLNGQH